jgi:hypothetical protein
MSSAALSGRLTPSYQDAHAGRPSMSLGAVHHVSCLEEAITIYASARFAGAMLPSFTTTIEEWPTFIDDVKHSYTIEHEVGKKTYRWLGVMLCVTAINHKPLPYLDHAAPSQIQ